MTTTSDDAAQIEAFEEALEQTYAKDPEDPGAALVYADWLQGKGDPLGELILVQHLGHRAREEELLAQHGPRWLGRLPDFDGITYFWRRGFLDYLDVSTHRGYEFVEAMAHAPACRFLRSLEIHVEDRAPASAAWDDPDPASDPIVAIERFGFPRSVRRLRFSLMRWLEGSPPTLYAPLYRHWQNVEELALDAPSVLGRMDLPRLRSLELTDFAPRLYGELSGAHLPNVESLTLFWSSTSLDVDRLHDFPVDAFPRLHAFRPHTFTRLGASETRSLLDTPLVRRARVVDLDGILDLAGAAELANSPHKLAHLESLSLIATPFSAEDAARLRARLGPRAIFERT